jgi:quinol monooxygenase YgiN
MKAVIVTYVVKNGREAEFEKLLKRHWKILQKEGLTTKQLPFLLRDPESRSVYKEIFEWKSKSSFQKAHRSRKVQQIWQQLMELTEEGGIEPAFFVRIR